MIRGVIMLVLAAGASLALLGGIIILGIHRMHAAQQAADAAWHASPPATAPASDDPATAPAIAPAAIVPPPPRLESVNLWAKDAEIHGNVTLAQTKAKTRPEPNQSDRAAARARMREIMGGNPVRTYLTGFHEPGDFAQWTATVPVAGDYEIDVAYACPMFRRSSHFVIRIGEKEIQFAAEGTRTETNFRVTTVGTLNLPAGTTTVILRPLPPDDDSGPKRAFLNVRHVQLVPAS